MSAIYVMNEKQRELFEHCLAGITEQLAAFEPKGERQEDAYMRIAAHVGAMTTVLFDLKQQPD